MRQRVTVTWTRIFFGGAVLTGVGMMGALLVAWSGVYSVAASRGHPEWLNAFLEFGMKRSVEVNAPRQAEPDLEDAGLIALGASHFAQGCAPCHGAPGTPVNPIYEGMLPVPPQLSEKVSDWENHELHWIVRHGIQYAGMPGWAGAGRDDEVWAMVAFLRRLPDLNADAYRRLSSGNLAAPEATIEQLVTGAEPSGSLSSCARCHETAAAPPISADVPRLSGQTQAYLERALREYKAGTRQSGYMEPVAASLSEEEADAVAAWFADLAGPVHPDRDSEGADRGAGERIARIGDASRRVAACDACHGPAANEAFPRLAGQSEAYLRSQLALWQTAPPSASPYADLMAGAVGRMTPDQARDVAAWYASQPPGNSIEAASPP